MRKTFALVALVVVALFVAIDSFAFAQGGGGGAPAARLRIDDRYAIPGTVIRVKIEIETPVPTRAIDLLFSYTSHPFLEARPSFWVDWQMFSSWLPIQNVVPGADRIVLVSRYPFQGSGTLGSFRVKVSSLAEPGTALFFPAPVASFNDTISPVFEMGAVIVGPRILPGDVDQNGRITALDVVRALDIAIPDPQLTPLVPTATEILASDVSGDGVVDTYDCWQILYKVVFPEYHFDVEDMESGTSVPTSGGLGKVHLIAEDVEGGVILKTARGSSLRTADFTIKGSRSFTVEPQLLLQQTISKVVRKGNRESRVGFVNLESLAGDGTLAFVSGARVEEIEINGKVNEGIPLVVQKIGRVTAVDDALVAPTEFALLQNYPNPFNPTTTISFDLPQAGFVDLRVYNLLGEEVATLFDEERPAGTHIARFDATALPSGIYIYRLKAGGAVLSRKMILLR